MLGVLAGAALGGLIFGRSGDSKHEHSYTSHKTVTVNRAPTDESVRLLMEMEEKTLDRVTRAFVTKRNNIMEGAVIEMRNNRCAFDFMTIAVFKLNGRVFKFNVEMGNSEWDNADRPYEILCGLFAKQVAAALVEKVRG